jgi:hypothetical protein
MRFVNSPTDYILPYDLFFCGVSGGENYIEAFFSALSSIRYDFLVDPTNVLYVLVFCAF